MSAALLALVAPIVVSLQVQVPPLAHDLLWAVAVVCLHAACSRRLRRPGRLLLELALAAVAVGALLSALDTAYQIYENQVGFTGVLGNRDVLELCFSPGETPADGLCTADLGGALITRVETTIDVLSPTAGYLALWSAERLLPWLLALLVVALLFPLTRAAERGELAAGVNRSLVAIGVALLAGIPASALLSYLVDHAGARLQPVGPLGQQLELSALHVVPGLLVLLLAVALSGASRSVPADVDAPTAQS